MVKRVEGSCSGCGACCKIVALPDHGFVSVFSDRVTVAQPRLSDDQKHYYGAHGISVLQGEDSAVALVTVPFDKTQPGPWIRDGVYSGNRVTYVKSRCPQLTEDNRCLLHGTPDKPKACLVWPRSTDDLSATPECSYTIVEVEDAPV